jgi:DNA (cytosine-5)-methyltransferase 1
MLGVAQPIPIDMRNAGRDPEKHDEMNRQGVGVGDSGDPAHTVTSAFVHAVAQPIAMRESGQGYWMEDEKAGTLRAEGENRPSRPSHVIAQPITQFGEIAGTLTARYDNSPCADRGMNVIAQPIGFQQTADCLTAAYGTKWNGNASATNGSLFAAQEMTFGFDAYNHTIQGQVNQPLRVSSAPGQVDAVGGIVQGMAVRRLTPIECERLQGFPDNYTEIPWRKKLADQCPDGPRYKALGNSWAVPVVHWIGKRIQAQLEK